MQIKMNKVIRTISPLKKRFNIHLCHQRLPQIVSSKSSTMKNAYKILFLICFTNISLISAQCDYTDALCAQDVHPDYELYYLDSDGDGYGDPNLCFCLDPDGNLDDYVKNSKDCNDNDASVPQKYYQDNDGDGLGANGNPFFSCNPPENYVNNNDDCNDNSPLLGEAKYYYPDMDGDGYGVANLDGEYLCVAIAPEGLSSKVGDCDDNDPTVHPGASELCTGEDKNCDGVVNFVQPNPPVVQDQVLCGPGEIEITPQYVPNNDENPKFYRLYNSNLELITEIPFAESHFTQIDVNTTFYVSSLLKGCEGDTSTLSIIVLPDDNVFYRDADHDGFALLGSEVVGCENPNVEIYVTENQLVNTQETDCNDNNPNINPETWWYVDEDGDGLYLSGSAVQGCENPNANIYVTVDQLANPLQEDCDDNNPNIAITIWYADVDYDGLGDPSTPLEQCFPPPGYVLDDSDNCPNFYDPNNNCTVPETDPSYHNYIYERTYQEASAEVIDPNRFTNNPALMQQITFYDGLGRPSQQVAIAQSPNNGGKDIVTSIDYDAFGRQDKEWLPYVDAVGNPGSFRPSARGGTIAHYLQHYGSDLTQGPPNPFSQKEFESSPLNRVLKQGAPGSDWALGYGHEIQITYTTNSDPDAVRQFDVSSTFNKCTYIPSLMENGNGNTYTAGELYKNITYDENHDGSDSKLHSTEEFTDKTGKVVLKRTYALVNGLEEGHDTYYVYDNFGNLSYVLPPKMNASTQALDNIQSLLDDLAYQYVYNHRNRLVEKKIPGKGWEHIIYNKLDQPIMTQDAIQRNHGEWLFTKYDALGRVAYTGKATSTMGYTRKTIQNEVDALSDNLWVERSAPSVFGGTKIYYNNGGYPTKGSVNTQLTEILTINYYDDYQDFDLAGASKTNQAFGVVTISNVKGLSTATRVKVLETDKWITTVFFYDEKARSIFTHSHNEFLGTLDIMASELNFVGAPLRVRSFHKRKETIVVTLDSFTYNHAGRLLSHTQCIGDETLVDDCAQASNPKELIAFNAYDDLGQLRAKKVGGIPANSYQATTGLQEVDHTYNIRGWLKTINDVNNLGSDLFGFRIGYNEGENPLYNGNIALTEWRTDNVDNALKKYDYTYDALNRIKDATDNSENQRYTLGNMSYDKNGNIRTLDRKGHTNENASNFGMMDALNYTYDQGNKLLSVWDNGNDEHGFVDGSNDVEVEYSYDENGNMTQDLNKGINTIIYNHLNLPTSVETANGKISYIYDATGYKLQKTVEGSVTEYAGNYIYENEALQFFNTPEGYVTPDGQGGYDHVYQYKDHLGNIRLSYTDNEGNLGIVEENNYYPFGLRHKGYNNVVSPNANGVAQKYQYSGKKIYDELGLNTYDFGARMYDANLGRFMSVDPHSESYYNWTPYNYVANNPLLLIDPDGKDWFYYSKNGKDDPTWNWHDGSEYNTGVKDDDGNDVILQGVEAVVVFNGSVNEKLGTKKKGDKGYDGRHTEGYMDGEGAVTASVTVHGPGGADDVQEYAGYTMRF